MKKYIFVIITLVFFNFTFGQNTLLKGKITDKETNTSLPFVTIEIKNLKTGTTSNENGVFKIEVNSQNKNRDTIEFSYLGYKKVKFSIEDILNLNDKLILMESTPMILNEVLIIPKKYKTIRLGIFDKKPQSKQITNLYNNKIGNYIENKKHKVGRVKSVSFYIDQEGHFETPFRIRIYDLNKERNCPGNDILNQNVVISANKAGWINIDMTKYNIPFPQEGLFVMMEWINSGDKYFYEKEMIKKNESGEPTKEIRKFYGQTIGSVIKKSTMITWGIALGNDWIPYKLYAKGYINAMINAEIIYSVD
jgi:hypothetical protein